jgi:hypothetical protein
MQELLWGISVERVIHSACLEPSLLHRLEIIDLKRVLRTTVVRHVHRCAGIIIIGLSFKVAAADIMIRL